MCYCFFSNFALMKPPVKFGLLASILIIGFYLGIYYSGNMFTPLGQFSRIISLVIMIPFVALSIRAKRTELGGYIGYRESLKAGLGATFIISVALAVFFYFFFRLELQGVLLSLEQEMIIKNKVPHKEAYERITAAYYATQPGAQATSTLMWTLIAGAIISFASATFIVKKPNEA